MAKPLYPRAIRISLGIAASTLVWISIASYWSTHSLITSYNDVTRAHEAIQKFQHIEVLMEAAQSGVHGFLITGEGDRLNAYHYAKLMVPTELREMQTLSPASPEKKASYDALQEHLQKKLARLARLSNLKRSEGFSAASQAVSNEDGAARDAMERLLSEIQEAEMSQLRTKWDKAARRSLHTKAILALATLVSLSLMGWVALLLARQSQERRKAESAQGRMETFLNSIIERIPYMILVKEATHLKITLANQAAVEWLGREREEILNSLESEFRPEVEARASALSDRKALGEGKMAELEEHLAVPGKPERILFTQKIPVPDEDGNPAYVLIISEDITQRKKAERMLELSRDAAVEATRLRSEFIRNMSHEFRTPLSVVIGMSSLLLDTHLSPEQKRFAETVRRAADGLSTLTKSILDFSKMEGGSFSLESLEFNLIHVVDEVVAMMNDQATAKHIGLVTLVSPEIPSYVRGDPSRLRQVLTQLVGNAVKFTERGEISVHVTLMKQTETQLWVHWTIKDTGIGIHKDVQDHLFEPFRQGDGSRTRKYGGTGLGLAMAKRLLELMGGQINFDSAPGEGSTFSFVLPLNKRHVQGPRVQMSSLPWARTRVAVISEQDSHRRLIQQQLNDCALASEVFSSGQAAFDFLRREKKAGRPITVVLLDMQMADMDGVTFAKKADQAHLLEETKLILMTQDKAILDATTAASLGFSGTLSMPTEPQILYERLATWIDPHEPRDRQHAA